jgi:hypothetical protein
MSRDRCLAESLLWFDLTRLEPTIYQTRGEHANHYSTDSVSVSGHFPPISHIVLNNFMKISLTIKEFPEENFIKLAIVLQFKAQALVSFKK